MGAIAHLEALLKPLGIPIAYREFKPYKGKPVPPPPFLVYYAEHETGSGADGKNLYKALHFVIEPYTDAKSCELEESVEKAIRQYEFEKYEDYIETERLYMVYWEFDIYEKTRRG